jgi:hypothetical protein
MRVDELRVNFKILQFIGKCFEETGLCSIDTLKILKEEAFKIEAMNIN